VCESVVVCVCVCMRRCEGEDVCEGVMVEECMHFYKYV
jgi:hypothetical protein